MHRGKISEHGALRELLHERSAREIEVTLSGVSPELREALVELDARARAKEGHESAEGLFTIACEGSGVAERVLELALSRGAGVIEVTPRRESLETLFVRGARSHGGESDAQDGAPR
jgi:ABC-2 type transport system ATP-binding protein